MCIRDSPLIARLLLSVAPDVNTISLDSAPIELDIILLEFSTADSCLLYTSDAADERSSVDLGGRRIIKKKKTEKKNNVTTTEIYI